MNYTILEGDNRDTLKTLEDNSVDAVVTDPPYGIDFLGKDWDANTGALETYKECLRVLKPGGYLLAFSAARTYHHLAITLEQAGFEIRDQLMWLYSSGFPKALDIGKGIDKRAGKGKEQTIRAEYNGGKHGPKSVDLSMQGTRCPVCKRDSNARYSCNKGQDCGMVYKAETAEAQAWSGWKTALKPAHEPICMARKPLKGSTIDNVLEHGVGALNIDATRVEDRFPSNVLGEVEGYQKFFYCPKVSRKERHTGIDNNHPTVKPVELMKYLIKLVTPPNSTVLDPFNGSGSTGMAAVELGHTYIGCELDPAYVNIAKKRIEAWNTPQYDNNYGELFE
jgi:DNA modification methylase